MYFFKLIILEIGNTYVCITYVVQKSETSGRIAQVRYWIIHYRQVHSNNLFRFSRYIIYYYCVCTFKTVYLYNILL